MAAGRKNIICFFLTAGLLIACPAFCSSDYGYIDISNPFLRKIPLAVPLFKTLNDGYQEKQIAKEASSLLSESLEFTGYFKIINRNTYLIDRKNYNIVIPAIKFKNWTVIGSELLITGGISIDEDIVKMELRLYDTFKEKLLVGKRYKGLKDDYRKMIHRFCGEVIYQLTGKQGFFNSKIAFVSTGTGNKEIFICDFDGHNPKQFTYSKNITLSPAWSSDAKWIAYTSYAKGNPDLYIKHLKEKRGTVVSKKGINVSPSWFPGKFALAATLSFSGDPEIYLLTGAGKIIKKLTDNWGIDVSPAWSPDGRKIAFVSNRSGTPQIYLKDLYTKRVERLTFQGRYNTTPSWSPNGDKIAYSSSDNGKFNIYVIGIDGREMTQLTRNSGNNESPSWSSDGSMIVFSSTREGRSRLYVMTVCGADQRRLLALPGDQTDPAWSPRITDN